MSGITRKFNFIQGVTICKAFTLAEVLIALGIIGIVAAMTIPSLMQNISNKQLITATNNFNRRFGEALKIMNSQGVLAGRKTTENFVNELSKVFKVAKICDNTQLNQCFETSVVWGEAGVADLSNVSTAKDISLYNWGTNVVGVRFVNNVSALIAYNPKCKQDQYNNNLIQVGGDEGNVGFTTNNCFAMLYDVNSGKKPNTLNQDVQMTSNARNIKQGVIATINGVKITKIVRGNKYDSIDCTDLNSDDHEFCYGSTTHPTDYWTGAAKLCEGKDNMANNSDLIKIAEYLYDVDSIDTSSFVRSTINKVTVSANPTRATELQGYGLPAVNERSGFQAWSSTYYSKGGAILYGFYNDYMFQSCNNRTRRDYITICVQH